MKRIKARRLDQLSRNEYWIKLVLRKEELLAHDMKLGSKVSLLHTKNLGQKAGKKKIQLNTDAR
jgi:hypothetical protein